MTVALFALALWRLLCAAMGDPVEGSEPKDDAVVVCLDWTGKAALNEEV